jgi:uncharacterized protein YjbI with pentapeptide repeats
MTDQIGVDWPTCAEPGCIGIRLARGGKCLAHASARRRNAALKRLRDTGDLDARGVPITEALLEQILAAAPRDTAAHPTFATTRFSRATFQDNAWFREATFQGDARFERATFQNDAWFGEATFQRHAFFHTTTFQGIAWFDEATFQDIALFEGATFQRHAEFHGATFQDIALFEGATFQDAQFGKATFQDAGFGKATFQGTAGFRGATFQNAAWFAGVIVRHNARFVEVRFEQERQFGPLLVYGLLRLDGAHFMQLTLIEASSRGLSCQRTRFPAGVQFRLRGAEVVLDDVDLPNPSLLTGVDTLSNVRLARTSDGWSRPCSAWPQPRQRTGRRGHGCCRSKAPTLPA